MEIAIIGSDIQEVSHIVCLQFLFADINQWPIDSLAGPSDVACFSLLIHS